MVRRAYLRSPLSVEDTGISCALLAPNALTGTARLQAFANLFSGGVSGSGTTGTTARQKNPYHPVGTFCNARA